MQNRNSLQMQCVTSLFLKFMAISYYWNSHNGLFPFAHTLFLGYYLLWKMYVHFLSFLKFSFLPILFLQYNYFQSYRGSLINDSSNKANHFTLGRGVDLLPLVLTSPIHIYSGPFFHKAHCNVSSDKKAYFPLIWILLLSQKHSSSIPHQKAVFFIQVISVYIHTYRLIGLYSINKVYCF